MASGENLGAKFTLDITNLKAGLAEANKMIRQSESEFIQAAASMQDWTQSADGLAARTKSLNDQIDLQRAKINALIKAKDEQIKKMQAEGASDDEIASATDKVNAQLQKEQKQLETLRGRFANAQKQQDAFNKNASSLTNTISKQESELNDLKKEYIDAVAQYGKNSQQAKALASQIKNLSGELANNQKQYNEASEAADKLDKSIDEVNDSASNASGGFSVMKAALANLVSQGITAAAGALKNFAGDVIQTGMQFDASMSNVAALSGATGDELQLLEDTAREFGATTQFSASEAADALGYMALAGWDAEQSSSALGGVLNLAAASGMELAQASDMVTDYLSAFGLEADQSAEFADMLAYAQANSNTSAEQLGEAYKNCAANLNASGQSVQTTTALLASMANQGLKGSEAGTALTAVVRDMTARMQDGAIAIGDTNVEVMDANGNYRDLTDILADVEAATEGMGDAERATALSSTFTSDSIKGLNLILNEGVDSAAAFEEELNNSSGSAEEMAKIMNDNLSGDLKSLSSAFDELKLTIFDSANAPLRDMVQIVSGEVLPALTDMINGVEGADTIFGESVGNLVNTAVSNLMSMLPQALTIAQTLIPTVITGVLSQLPTLTSFITGQLLPAILNLLSGDLIPNILSSIMALIPQLISQLLSAAPLILKAAIDLLMNLVSALPVITENLLTELPLLIQQTIETLLSMSDILYDGAYQLFMMIVETLPVIIQQLSVALPSIIDTAVSGLISAMPQILSAATTLFMQIVRSLPSIISSLLPAIFNLISSAGSTLIRNAPLILKSAVQLFMQIVKSIPTIAKQLFANMPQIINSIKNGLTAGFDTIKSVGSDLIRGLWNGIKDMASWIKDKIKGFGKGVLDSLKAFFGIKSPSRVMRDVIGKNLALGIGVGFDDGMSDVAHGMQTALNDAWPTANAAINVNGNVNGDVQSNRTAAGAVVINQTNNYSQQHSRFEIYQSKQATAAAVRAAIAGV